MSMYNKPVWSEGLFIKPSHFQQQERYIENTQKELFFSKNSYGWGFTHLELDEESLAMGKIGILSAKGIFPDGTYFSIPDYSSLPDTFEPEENIHNEIIYICIPIKNSGQEVSLNDNQNNNFRYNSEQASIRNTSENSINGDNISVAKLNIKILGENENRDGYLSLGIAKIEKKDSNDIIIINKKYIPPFVNVNQSNKLHRLLDHTVKLLKSQINNLSKRISASGTGGVAEVEDIMKLQIFNRNVPVFMHLRELPVVHPINFYEKLIQLSGELASFSGDHTAPDFLPYQHNFLFEIFDETIIQLKDFISKEIDPRATNIPLKDPRYGIYRAIINDKTLLENSHFVLAVKAESPPEELRNLLPQQTRITSIETIRDLIQQNTLGIPIKSLSTVPRQLPFHQGFIYFDIEKNSSHWKNLQNSSGIAFHISGNYSNLELELWAIREN